MSIHSQERAQGDRFAFGTNWQSFLSTLNDQRIEEAEKSLQAMLGMHHLSEKTFLDIGSGSGLFSLAARRLGASVHSFDFDPQSVACTEELRERYYGNDKAWIIEEGSILDDGYVRSLGRFDVVYAWGVLHHTNNMMKALANAALLVKEGGLLFIAIYNDQDIISRVWSKVKKTYCSSSIGRYTITVLFIPLFILQSILIGFIKNRNPLGSFIHYKKKRGMSIYHDWLDWLGGYPFEVSKPEKIFHFYKNIGFLLINMTTTNRLGCNQFVFKKVNKEST